MNALQKIKERQWFYPFNLPDGTSTQSYLPPDVVAIHETRWQMLRDTVLSAFPDQIASIDALDIAAHQGYFSLQLARLGIPRITAVDVRSHHVSDLLLMAEALGLPQVQAITSDVFSLAEWNRTFDLVIQFGLLYHLENPVGALRIARQLTKRLCIIETQVVPNVSGNVDWGSYQFVKPLQGIFGIIDELDEVHAPEASVTGICLAPSLEGLMWILRAVGFSQVKLITPPGDGYEQLKFGKRVMVAAFV